MPITNPASAGCFTSNQAPSAAAVVFADAEAPAQLTRKAPPARISVIPDPHAEIAPDAFTRAEFADALAKIYAYATRKD